MKKFSKALLTCAVTACLLSTSVASAAIYGEFTFTPQPTNPTNPTIEPFQADKISGSYVEVATFNPDGTFDASLLWTAGQFMGNQGKAKVTGTGLNGRYQIYATYRAHGFVTTSGSGSTAKTSFTFLPRSPGTYLKMYVDNQADTGFPQHDSDLPATGTDGFDTVSHPFAHSADDVLIDDSLPLTGSGYLDPTMPTCGDGGILCGSFGSTTQFALTTLGKTYFSTPNLALFFDTSFQSGQLDKFTPTGTVIIDGSLDVTFANAVPEPATIVLFGLGLLGVSLARIRKQS